MHHLIGYRVVLLEGCDGVGKHPRPPTRRCPRLHGRALTDLAKHRRPRHPLPRPGHRPRSTRAGPQLLVYGPFLRGHSRLTADQARNLAAFVHQQEGVLAHLTATPSVLRDRLSGLSLPMRGVGTGAAGRGSDHVVPGSDFLVHAMNFRSRLMLSPGIRLVSRFPA